MKTETVAAISLPTAGIQDVLDGIIHVKARRDLDGGQRQLVDEAEDILNFAIDAAEDGLCSIAVADMRVVLHVLTFRQAWLPS